MKIMEASCARSTWASYSSVFRKWEMFCSDNNVVILSPSISQVLSFLARLYDEGLSYSSINAAKSGLSTIIGYIDSVKVGEHELVQRFMRGVFKLRPSVPKYRSTWDADLVLRTITNWHEDVDLELRDLTLKLVALIALTTGQRVQTLCSIAVANIIWGDPVKINLPGVLKTTSPSNPNPQLILPYFKDNPKICVASTLLIYVNRTKEFREKNKTDSLLLSMVPPHKPVCTQTVSNWLVKMLEASGINTNDFKGHSFRHSSSTKAASRGVSTDSIIQTVGWSNARTFARYYNRDIIENDEFANAVLGK